MGAAGAAAVRQQNQISRRLRRVVASVRELGCGCHGVAGLVDHQFRVGILSPAAQPETTPLRRAATAQHLRHGRTPCFGPRSCSCADMSISLGWPVRCVALHDRWPTTFALVGIAGICSGGIRRLDAPGAARRTTAMRPC
jgi:hypothetical protein